MLLVCAQGTLVTLAIGLHNVPEGLAVATVMAAKGTSPRRTLLWTALTALPQALVAPPAYVFVDTFRCVAGYYALRVCNQVGEVLVCVFWGGGWTYEHKPIVQFIGIVGEERAWGC